jgi:hypothetical protein
MTINQVFLKGLVAFGVLAMSLAIAPSGIVYVIEQTVFQDKTVTNPDGSKTETKVSPGGTWTQTTY